MRRTSLAFAAAAFCATLSIPARADDTAELRAQLDALRAEVDALRHEVDALRQRPPAAAPSAPSVAATAATAAPARDESEATTLFGYGEINYTRPTRHSEDAQADVRRAVLGFTHAFDESTRVVGEIEWEHAIVSADDEGEVEVEQLFAEHQLTPDLGVRAGLFLIPLGFINEHHEPTAYYGVERNFVETAIIPSTWREGGVSLYGSTGFGLSWNVGVTTGFDLTKWDPSSGEGREEPLASIHQELQLAKAHDASFYAAGNWQGIPGLTLGGGVFTGKIGQGADDFPARDARLTLGEAHARWQRGPFDVSALYARGHISDTEALNLTFVGNPTPVPKSFWGGYVQGAWRAWERDGSSLAPFVRYEELNTAASYERVPAGLGVAAAETERVWTVGLNYWLIPNLVFKIDYQDFRVDEDRNRVDLGLGYLF